METYYIYCALVIYILYKILDRLIRIPYVGKYEERYILVTGCDSGFGKELVKRLDRIGCHVFAGCLTEKGETDLAKTCTDRLIPVSMDVSKPESVQRAFEFVKSKIPEGKGLWGVLNNAGVLGTCGRMEWLTLEDYNTVLTINLTGLIDVTMTFLPLVKQARGRIVNTASVFGRFVLEFATPYCISKFGVEAFTDGLRRSLRQFGCHALLVEPGLHKTPMTSGDNTSRCIKAGWNQAKPEVKAEFGLEYYTYMSTKHLAVYDRVTTFWINDVVDAYEEALLSRFPRARYPVGRDAVFLWLPLQMLPEWISDMVMEKMDYARPLPAAILDSLH